MPSSACTILMIGDVVGQAGLRALTLELPRLKRDAGADLVVVNGENADSGFGIGPENVAAIYAAGADVITTGNHVWQHKDIQSMLENDERILRPANYPARLSGAGYVICETRRARVAVMHLQGRSRMPMTDCPFRKAKEIIREVKGKADVIVVDLHAEATDEKEALASYIDGQVAAVVGTHTHVQTADERILPRGSAFMTDLGMTGPDESVIGFRSDISIKRSLTQMPLKNEVSNNPATVCGLQLEIDIERGLPVSMKRICSRPGV